MTGCIIVTFRLVRRSGAAKIDFTVESILAAHVISNLRSFDFTCVESILHGAKAM